MRQEQEAAIICPYTMRLTGNSYLPTYVPHLNTMLFSHLGVTDDLGETWPTGRTCEWYFVYVNIQNVLEESRC
ncbi:hypothetical protein KC357_g198 [Hortaea werneckii]|nr:hypothetical protein KC357_g198 [Hortaea werneckii]